MIDLIKEAATEVYNELGPGHNEVIYEAALNIELHLRIAPSRRQVPVNLWYKGYSVGMGYIDLLVDEKIVVEIKSISKLTKKDELQVQKYLVATGLEQGLLINYGPDLEIAEVGKVANEQAISTEGGN